MLFQNFKKDILYPLVFIPLPPFH